eukprot:TRINITY_DN52456_c0_g1_i1.p1 TRINITY_DN52456_c0_g1~~TRINITY_DN52456_c0_g1_i1.p1  ORF type:complete len:438 (+),score=94.39 TRINITY_DN52456_c0_g1_i1:30-1343(+)
MSMNSQGPIHPEEAGAEQQAQGYACDVLSTEHDCTSSLVNFLERGNPGMSEAHHQQLLQQQHQMQMQMQVAYVDRRPLEFPNPPRLPKEYSATNVSRWEGAWAPVEDISYCAVPGKLPVSANCSKVLPYLYLGNLLCASDLGLLRSKGITHVLTLTKRILPDEVVANINCKQIVIEDTPRAQIQEVWEESFKHIRAAKESGGAILVHCRAGVSRGGCCCMAYLMKYHGMTLRNAYAHVKSCRPIVHPNKGFVRQLRDHEVTLRGNLDGDIDFLELPYTLWERAEHLGLSDPIPNLDLSLKAESAVSAAYESRYNRRNPYLTMDAGLGGKMMLHSVELYWIGDFEWIDAALVDILYRNRPPQSNYVSRKHRKRMEQDALMYQIQLHQTGEGAEGGEEGGGAVGGDADAVIAEHSSQPGGYLLSQNILSRLGDTLTPQG